MPVSRTNIVAVDFGDAVTDVRLLKAGNAADHRMYRRWSGPGNALADRAFPPLTANASHGRLWLGIAGLMATTCPPRRQAAATALAALCLASATSNVLAKRLIERPRPQPYRVPLPRALTGQPKTSSFPSGHSASAAAFATVVALTNRRWLCPSWR